MTGTNLQIFRNPERKLNALWHTHKQTHTMFFFTKPLATGWLKMNSVVCGAEEEVAPARSHMMQKKKKQEVTLKNASAEWRVSLYLVLKGLPSFCISHFQYHWESLGQSTLQIDLLSTFTVTRGKNPSVVKLSFCPSWATEKFTSD